MLKEKHVEIGAASVTAIEEKGLAEWLFTGPTVPISVLWLLDLEPVRQLALAVPTRALFQDARRPGDIDVLIQHDESAGSCTAIEFKRVKVKAETFQNGSPNKIRGLGKGVRQANALYELGFSKTVLLVAIVTDGRTREQANFAHRGPTPELLSKIWNFHGRRRLSDGVGLGFIEVVQPVDKPVEMAGGIGAYMVKAPIERKQKRGLAMQVYAYFASRSASVSSMDSGLE